MVDQYWRAYQFLNPQHRTHIETERGEPLPRPELDGQRLAELDCIIREAMATGKTVRLTAYDCWSIRRYTGRLRVRQGWIIIETETGIVSIPPIDVIDVITVS